MIKKKNKKHRGAALLVVLFIVMAITILAYGFMARSDVELACGQNMALRTAMDYLAESGLQHARGLILNPQDVGTEYWMGATGQQLITGSSDYYDVTVTRLDPCTCNYQITSEAYRQKGTEKIGRSSLTGELRLDPCIALWTGTSWNSESGKTTVSGDVYCNGDLSGGAAINGDAFARGSITATVLGAKNPNLTESPIALPGFSTSDFSSSYYVGTSNYSADTIAVTDLTGNYNWSAGNPAGVFYCNGDVNMPSDVHINGMLVVNGNLTVKGTGNVITAVKNFPALLVGGELGGELIMEDGATLEIDGLAQIENRISVKNGAENVHVTVNGALFILNGSVAGLASSAGSTLKVTAAPDKAAIQVVPQSGTLVRWSPAAGAFFRSIRRQ